MHLFLFADLDGPRKVVSVMFANYTKFNNLIARRYSKAQISEFILSNYSRLQFNFLYGNNVDFNLYKLKKLL
jgi:hypothetical protein